MMAAVQAPGVHARAVERGVFSVHLGRDNHAAALEGIQGLDPPVIVAKSWRPRQMRRARIFHAISNRVGRVGFPKHFGFLHRHFELQKRWEPTMGWRVVALAVPRQATQAWDSVSA